MSGRLKLLIGIVLVAGLSFGIWKYAKREKPSYESRFAEYIWIEYPPGQLLESEGFGGDKMDVLLRGREVGYLGGVTSKGEPPEVVEVELAVDLEVLAAEALVEELRTSGLLPQDAKFEVGTYPREGLE